MIINTLKGAFLLNEHLSYFNTLIIILMYFPLLFYNNYMIFYISSPHCLVLHFIQSVSFSV